jgi:large repetitive protein
MKTKGFLYPVATALATLALHFSFITQAQAAFWFTNSPMTTARQNHTATLLSNGKVLVAGGSYFTNGYWVYLSSCELFDPVTGTWTATGAMATGRELHTATLLPNGKVLVAGGSAYPSQFSSAELYDPATGMWTATGTMLNVRYGHTATLLPNGKVLVAGYGSYYSNAELYDPATGSWSDAGAYKNPGLNHTATLLSGGKVLVAGGTYFSSVELYDPGTGGWTNTGGMTTARASHTATLLPNGTVLVAGGQATNNVYLASAELFDPATGSWTPTGNLPTTANHTATLLPNGTVLVTGGQVSNNVYLASSELYNPSTGNWTDAGKLNAARAHHTATLLPNGKVLVVGGQGTNGVYLASTELYDPLVNPSTGTWTGAGYLNNARINHTATLLPNGKVLVAGGVNNVDLATAELYDTASGNWTITGVLAAARYNHTATLLPNGEVLVAGGIGNNGFLSSAELYDPVSGTWTNTGALVIARGYHTATLLPNGTVLVAGGQGTNGVLSSAELYDPISGAWTATGSMTTNRSSYTAMLLRNGKVLVAGGAGSSAYLSSAELYDPTTGLWTATGSLNAFRAGHTATLLPNGKVLVAAGSYYSGGYHYLSSAELYDPITGTWATTSALATARGSHTATLLANGKVIVAGGVNGGNPVPVFLSSAELYDPATGKWTATVSMGGTLAGHTAILLPNQKVLVAAGQDCNFNCLVSGASLYDVGLGFDSNWQPQIATVTSPLNLGSSLTLTGSRFRGISEGSGGSTEDSPTDYPLVQLRSVESGQTSFLLITNWSSNLLASAPVSGLPSGYTLATVFVNGIPSTSSILRIAPTPTAITLTKAVKLPGGAFQFGLTNVSGAVFTALATTNLALSLNNWTVLGGVAEIASGQFQFTDPQRTNSPQRFYRVRSP